MSKLLVVDDEQSICWGLQRLGESIGHDVVAVSSAEQALDKLDDVRPDAVVLDVRLPGMDGLSAIGPLRSKLGEVPIIVITAYGDLATAVEAVRNGAFEYITKPFELANVERVLARALAVGESSNEESQVNEPIGGLVGSSAALQEVFKRIALAASSDAGVLIYGESGTGKDLAARAIHEYSQRADAPFVAVNVASLSPTLAESELFGHVRNSFTGAEDDRTGLLVQADGGTLFLDEVADIPLRTQVKLLRALEHGEVTPVGSSNPVPTSFRIVSATHQDLPVKIREGSFRHDLYFRLGAFRIDMPPLRRRPEDIRGLAEYFVQTLHNGTGPPALSAATITELERRHWHGNVRELRNAIEHACIVARSGVIEPEHLPAPAEAVVPQSDAGAASLDERIVELVHAWAKSQLDGSDTQENLYDQLQQLIEPPLFRAAIDKYQGQIAAAARCLGLHRTTLRKKLNQSSQRDS